MSSDVPTLLTVRQFAERHPAFSESSLRWLIFIAGTPRAGADISRSIVRVGRRVLLDEREFMKCVRSGTYPAT